MLKNDKCGCLREVYFHDPGVINRFTRNETIYKEWQRDTCTCDAGPTDAYGDIAFIGANSSVNSKVSTNK